VIELRRVVKVYRTGPAEVYALRDISLDIPKGDMVAMMGPSGSGKSTLLHIIGCLDVPTSGRYRLSGREVEGLGADELALIRNQCVGFVFQDFYLLPSLTALENVELPLIYRGMSPTARRRRARDVLEEVGLGDRMHHTPSELSGGQQQRVAIARALAGDPELIMADEPTGNLDSGTGDEVLRILVALHRQGRTVIVVTHDPAVASRAERLIRLHDGQVAEDSREVN